MGYILNSYYLNSDYVILFLLLVVLISIKIAYEFKCDYSTLVQKMNQLSLTEIGT